VSTEPPSTPAISGSSKRPELVAVMPSATWRNSGKNASAPSSTDPVSSPTALATAITGLVNNAGGSSGSAALGRDQQAKRQQRRAGQAGHLRGGPGIPSAQAGHQHDAADCGR
jgi:hypothetical protein